MNQKNRQFPTVSTIFLLFAGAIFYYLGTDVLGDNFSLLLLAGYTVAIFVAVASTAFSILGAAEFMASPFTTDIRTGDDFVEWRSIAALLIGVLMGVLNFFGVLYIIGL